MEKAEEKYHNCSGKEKTAIYYKDNKDVIRRGNIPEIDTKK